MKYTVNSKFYDSGVINLQSCYIFEQLDNNRQNNFQAKEQIRGIKSEHFHNKTKAKLLAKYLESAVLATKR